MSHAYRKLLVWRWTTSAPGCGKLKPLPDPRTDVAWESELFINFVPSILIGTDASRQIALEFGGSGHKSTRWSGGGFSSQKLNESLRGALSGRSTDGGGR